MDKELDESFFGKIIYKSNYGSAPKHEVNSKNISSGLWEVWFSDMIRLKR